jgi:hydroxyacylglutathione hydrolase
MLNIYPIPALDSNYFWLLQPDSAEPAAYIIDPGAAGPVITAVDSHQLQLAGIIVTHHHHDHIGGINELVERYNLPVYGPRSSRIPQVDHYLKEGDTLSLSGLHLEVMEIPGHTQDHLAYLYHPVPDQQPSAPLLFCGDTLFSAGCGRLLDGTAAQLYSSLQRLAQLPQDTMIYCAHEYTLANLRFAHHLEPDNQAISERLADVENLRHRNEITVPTHLGLELHTNPFLRTHVLAVKRAAERYQGRKLETPLEVFTVLRQWKDNF